MGAPHIDADGKLDFTEAEVNLDIALRVRDILLAEGLRVFMIRDDDSAVNDPRVDINGDEKLSVIDESQARVDAINAVGADLLLSIHQNAYYGPEGEPAPDVGGTVTFYCADRPFAEDSLHFAELVQQNLIAAMNELGHDARNRGVMDDMVLYVAGEPGAHLIMLGPQTDRIVRPSNMPGCLSETMFLTHAKEAELARDPLAIDGLARAYANAVLAYFEQQDMPMDLDPE